MKSLALHQTLDQGDKEIQEKKMKEDKNKMQKMILNGILKMMEHLTRARSRNQIITMMKMNSKGILIKLR
jgi:hypothetical protein